MDLPNSWSPPETGQKAFDVHKDRENSQQFINLTIYCIHIQKPYLVIRNVICFTFWISQYCVTQLQFCKTKQISREFCKQINCKFSQTFYIFLSVRIAIICSSEQINGVKLLCSVCCCVVFVTSQKSAQGNQKLQNVK